MHQRSSVYLTSGFLAWDAWVVYTDITDATTNLMIAAIKGIVDGTNPPWAVVAKTDICISVGLDRA